MSTNIYVLKLESGKYYVGKSSNPTERYQQHLSGSGSTWTKKYKPVSLVKVISNVSPFEEDKITKEYMSKYGIENVRGGAYVNEKLFEEEKDYLRREIRAATDKCVRCGHDGHFAASCCAKTEIVEFAKSKLKTDTHRATSVDRYIGTLSESSVALLLAARRAKPRPPKAESPAKTTNPKKASKNCARCSRDNHLFQDCYAKTDIDGNDLEEEDEESECSRCGRDNHSSSECYARTETDGNDIDEDDYCGRYAEDYDCDDDDEEDDANEDADEEDYYD